MYPTVSFKNEKILGNLLDVLESYEAFKPTHWGNSETMKVEYNREELIEKVMDEGKVSEIHLYRNKSASYHLDFDVNSGPRSFFNMIFSKSIPKKLWIDFFTLSDQLAEITQPSYGLAHMFWPSSTSWGTERERLRSWMDICAQAVPVRFLPNGPLGLGTRTYIGSPVLNLMDAQVLYETPAQVSKLEWGGVKIDLLENPLESNPDTLLDPWLVAMKHLEKMDFFAIPHFDEEQTYISFTPSKAWIRYLNEGK